MSTLKNILCQTLTDITTLIPNRGHCRRPGFPPPYPLYPAPYPPFPPVGGPGPHYPCLPPCPPPCLPPCPPRPDCEVEPEVTVVEPRPKYKACRPARRCCGIFGSAATTSFELDDIGLKHHQKLIPLAATSNSRWLCIEEGLIRVFKTGYYNISYYVELTSVEGDGTYYLNLLQVNKENKLKATVALATGLEGPSVYSGVKQIHLTCGDAIGLRIAYEGDYVSDPDGGGRYPGGYYEKGSVEGGAAWLTLTRNTLKI